MRLSLMLFLSLAAAPLWSQNASLYGYGVRSCDDLVTSAKQWELSDEQGALAHVQLREWMSGFISGLSLALGSDVTRGAGVEGMMRQVVKQGTEPDDFAPGFVVPDGFPFLGAGEDLRRGLG